MLHFFDTPSFQVDLGVPVVHHQVAVAKVDGNNYSLIVAPVLAELLFTRLMI